ncbi:hemin receptor [Spirosoma sp. BT702]|uniref:Hemin receptor n=1 Tax=Spirosoma profusum TaxID=2771354 RepID=A0A927AWP5_9BACT|nr:globin domain-containing protein [Spirosoma profusum]MBD2705858.1 hemin receptor [Spirosoma profusum]
MTFEQARLVRKTFQQIANVTPESVGQLFYNRLFEIAPGVRPLFSRTAMPEQSVKLMAMLTYVVSKLHNVDSIVQDVTALARRQECYDVTEQHYVHVGQALLWMLEKALPDDWTPEVQQAWTACYVLLAETMINATRPSGTTLRSIELNPISYATYY